MLSKNLFIVTIVRIFFRLNSAVNNYFAEILDQHDERQINLRLAEKISSDRTVVQGPFVGHKFARSESVGSSFLPKLLGTYESEIYPVWADIQNQDFSVILDIGCAEGFYACALARMFPAADVHGFDLDVKAREFSIENAKANAVKNVFIHGTCDAGLIENYCSGKKSFILCDIEGAEKDLFGAVRKEFLSNTHMLIELHDGIDRSISSYLKSKFLKTHKISSFFSTDDIHRPTLMASYNLMNLSDDDFYLALRERRGHIMEWIYLKPKNCFELSVK